MMIKKTLLALCVVLSSISYAQTTTQNTASDIQKMSYAFGLTMYKQLPTDLDVDYLILALQDAKNQSVRFQRDELLSAVQNVQKTTSQALSPQANQKFLQDNAKKTGIKTTASGLQYQILQQGTGKKPKASSKVTVHYEGRLINGHVFDSSYQRNEATSFPLNMVIKGWTEGLQLLQEGGKIRLFIPASLGYGEREMPNIPAHSTLIFDVELIKVQ